MFAYVTDYWGRHSMRCGRCFRHHFCHSLRQQTTSKVRSLLRRNWKLPGRKRTVKNTPRRQWQVFCNDIQWFAITWILKYTTTTQHYNQLYTEGKQFSRENVYNPFTLLSNCQWEHSFTPSTACHKLNSTWSYRNGWLQLQTVRAIYMKYRCTFRSHAYA